MDLINVSFVGKALLIPVCYIYMKEVTLGRNLINASNVVKPSGIPITLKYIKEFTLERNPIHVKYVVKPLFILFKAMKRLTIERICMNVSNVGNLSALEYMKELTLERNSMNLRNVGKHSIFPVPFIYFIFCFNLIFFF
uniref:Uncharacterized protein n=1 Tax=Prolemur simus TaxID=1328070 RepID=A0A8C8ZVY2_PROSS